MKLLLVDARIPGYSNLTNNLKDDVKFIEYHPDYNIDGYNQFNTDIDNLKTQYSITNFDSLCIVTYMDATQVEQEKFNFVKLEDIKFKSSNLSPWTYFKEFIDNLNIPRFDFIIYSEENSTTQITNFSGIGSKPISNISPENNASLESNNYFSRNSILSTSAETSDILSEYSSLFSTSSFNFYGSSSPRYENSGVLIVANAGAYALLNKTTKNVYCWGRNDSGGLATDSTFSENTPVLLRSGSSNGPVVENVIDVIGSSVAFAALTSDGTVYAWGQFGQGAITSDYATQINIGSGTSNPLTNVSKIISSTSAFMAICTSGSGGNVYAWGNTIYGGINQAYATQINLGSGTSNPLTNITQGYSTSDAFTVISSTGGVYTWGYYSGSLIFNNTYATQILSSESGNPPLDGNNIVNIVSNDYVFVATINESGIYYIYAWGFNFSGNLNTVSNSYANLGKNFGGTAMTVSANTIIVPNSAAFAYFDSVNNKVYVWGNAGYGGIAVNYISEMLDDTPNSLSNISKIVASQRAFTAITDINNGGYVYTWGSTSFGGFQLGTAIKLSPFNGTTKVKDVYSNQRAFSVITENDKVYSWGSSTYGGIGQITSSSTPANQIYIGAGSSTELSSVKFLSSNSLNGGSFSTVNTVNNTVYAWGFFNNGGINTPYSSQVLITAYPTPPVTFPPLENVDFILNSGQNYLTISQDGSVIYKWGFWAGGEVGADKTRAYPILGLPPIIAAPTAPQNVVALEGDANAIITFTAPSDDGGIGIISYTATSNPGGITQTITGNPPSPLEITVSGLTNGTSYTFSVTATNGADLTGPAATSNSVTPTSTTPVNPSTIPPYRFLNGSIAGFPWFLKFLNN